MTGSRVVALGHFQPETVMTNADLEKLVETSDEWIRRRVGIETRHIAGPETTVTDMAAAAANRALERAGWAPGDVDLLVVATCTAVERSPNVASRVAAQLGIAGGPAVIDVNTACSGFTHGLALADHTMRAGAAIRGAGHRRRQAVGGHRLDGPEHLRPRRRRRGGGRGRAHRRSAGDRPGGLGITARASATPS